MSGRYRTAVPGEGLLRLRPHHEGQGASCRGVHSACAILFSNVVSNIFLLRHSPETGASTKLQLFPTA